ncbi:winged helix-turn-helix domain-containing protein [Skermanella pratensis]|uniref:winged helix-turn-helix domain-containing protein n=1 Tax=Skermanella pratensis TaxID=2233999 RepID=UPI001300F85B|nr:LysR family transcriptional regulator [Skermanella pratensis]
MAKLRLRIDFEPEGSLGPGKVALLEAIRRCGSISSAARELDMSYRRAWLLVDDLNQTFRQPVVNAMVGGRKGGGAGLTAFGDSVIRHYREMEAEAHEALARHLKALQDEVVAGGDAVAPPRECPVPEDGSERGEQERDCDGRKAMQRSLSKQPAGRPN